MKCNNVKCGRVITHSEHSKIVLVELIGIVDVELRWFPLGALAYFFRQTDVISHPSKPMLIAESR
jgi:hypothetical protein